MVGKPLGMEGPLIINPIYTLYHVGIDWVPIPFYRAPWKVKQLGALHPKGVYHHFPLWNHYDKYKYLHYLPWFLSTTSQRPSPVPKTFSLWQVDCWPRLGSRSFTPRPGLPNAGPIWSTWGRILNYKIGGRVLPVCLEARIHVRIYNEYLYRYVYNLCLYVYIYIIQDTYLNWIQTRKLRI